MRKVTSALLTVLMLALAAPAAAFGSVTPRFKSRTARDDMESHAIGGVIAGVIGVVITAVVVVSVAIPTVNNLNTSGMSSQSVSIIQTVPTFLALTLLVIVASLILNLFGGQR